MNIASTIALSILSFTCLATASAAGADLASGNELDAKTATLDLVAADDFNARRVQIDKLASSAQKFEDNLALVNQITANGHEAVAVIAQSGGKGNLALINQDARVNSAVAMIFQSGSGAHAVISQR